MRCGRSRRTSSRAGACRPASRPTSSRAWPGSPASAAPGSSSTRSGEAARRALEEGVYLVKPSLREFQHLTGLADAEESHLVAECGRWIASGRCEVVVLSLGAAGVLWVTAGASERLLSPTVPVRSTVGAGDSMLAGIVLRLQQGASLRDAVRFGVAAGAATVMNPGTELCRRSDVERFYTQMAAAA